MIRIGEMLAYQSYNVNSPLNGEAARWVEQNKHRLPLDPVSMLPEEERQDSSAEATLGEGEKRLGSSSPAVPGVHQQQSVSSIGEQPFPGTASADSVLPLSSIQTTCPACGARYRLSIELAARNVRCKKCGQTFKCDPDDPLRSPLGAQDS